MVRLTSGRRTAWGSLQTSCTQAAIQTTIFAPIYCICSLRNAKMFVTVSLLTFLVEESYKTKAVSIQFQLQYWLGFYHAWRPTGMGCKRDRLLLPDLQQMLANKQLLMLAEERVASKVQGEQWYIIPRVHCCKDRNPLHLIVSAWTAYSTVMKTSELLMWDLA